MYMYQYVYEFTLHREVKKFQTLASVLTRSARTVYGAGIKVRPNFESSTVGSLLTSSVWNSNFWRRPTKKMKISIRAKFSPRHARRPGRGGLRRRDRETENGVV